MKAVIIYPSVVRICGATLFERTLRTLKQTGITEVFVHGGEETILPEVDSMSIEPMDVVRESGYFLLIRGDHLFDPRIIDTISRETIPTLFLDDAPRGLRVAVDGDRVVAVDENAPTTNTWVGIALLDWKAFRTQLDAGITDIESLLARLLGRDEIHWKPISDLECHVSKLRRDITPYWLQVTTTRDRRQAEYRLINSGQKDPSDLLARYVHSPIENRVVAWLSNYFVTPNQITLAVNLFAYAATALFATGYLLIATLLTFVVGLMDGFDGKLARVKGMTTRVGAMEHTFDMLFEFSWLIALAYYVSGTMGSTPLLLASITVILIAFYRDIYSRFGQSTGKSLDIYAGFERVFRRVAGRRNLYNVHILLFVLLDLPFYAIVSIFIHALATALIYASRALLHLNRLDRGTVVVGR